MADIGIVYCGGCNPWYDRGALAKRLEAEVPGIRLAVYESQSPPPQAVLILSGCPAGCVKPSLPRDLPVFRVTEESQFGAAAAFLAAI